MIFYAIAHIEGTRGIEPRILLLAKRHDLCVPKIARHLSPDGVQIFLSICTSLKRALYSLFREKTLYLHRYRQKAVSRCLGNPQLLQFRLRRFFGTSRIFSNAAANDKAVAAGDCGHNLGNALFSSSVQAVFPATVNFISGCTWADLRHYFFTSFFHTTLTLPN